MRTAASPLLTQERALQENILCSSRHKLRALPVAPYSHKRKSGRDPKYSQESQLENDRSRAEQEVMENFFKLREVEAIQAEREALHRVSEVDCHARTILDEREVRYSQRKA